jgi:hypothetical protein
VASQRSWPPKRILVGSALLGGVEETKLDADMLRVAIDDALAIEGAPLAMKALHSLVKDEMQPGWVTIDAAKSLFDRSGHAAHDAHKRASESKEPPDVTQDALRAFIDKGEALLAAHVGDVRCRQEDRRPQTAHRRRH